MRSRFGLSLLVLLQFAVLGSSSSAHAWTRTVVKGARATVDIERDATLNVLLRLDVEVHAGWLHELELVDLGEGFELDRYRPPYFRSEDGELFRPEAEVLEDGRIRLSFPRREAPRRGEYRVFMRYRAKADVRPVEGATQAQVVWSVPAWETGLHGVSVEFRAPKGSSVPSELHDTAPGVDFQIDERPGRTLIEWRRNHLPRMTAWPLTIDVPLQAIDLPVSAPDSPTPNGFRPLSAPERRPLAWALLLIAAFVLLKRRSVESRMGGRSLLVRAPWGSVLLVSGVVLAAGQWLAPSYLLCAAPLLAFALHRPASSSLRTAPRDWHSTGVGELPKAETMAGELLDATTGTGLAVLLAVGASLIALDQPTAALLLVPVFVTGPRYHLPPSAAAKADALRRFTLALRMPPAAPEVSFCWEAASSDGSPRLRLNLRDHRAGLKSVSFVVASARFGYVLRTKIMLMVETRAQSEADDLMRRRTGADGDVRASDGGIPRLVDWNEEAIELLRVMSRKTPKPVKTSRGTWLLHEISEARREAA
jgi:hypothetical protein